MTLLDRQRVTAAFDRAEAYAAHAGAQRRIAASLASRIASLELPAHPAILEIGCGTGFLTAELLARGVDGRWLITDKAPAMVERCRAAVGDAPARRFAVLDGEYGLEALEGRFDLICASMAMQWFDDLPAAAARLLGKLAPGGHLIFNTLAEGTFAEWRAAHRALDLAHGAHPYPDAAELEQRLACLAPGAFALERQVEQHADARAFLRSLRMIGAATPRPGHRPLPPGALRRVCEEFEARGARTTYEVLVCHLHPAEKA